MLKIRLSRIGKKSQPSFRLVLQEHSSAVKGKFKEEFGVYKPATKDKDISVNLDRIKHWLSVGAQPSDAVAVLLKAQGLSGMERFIDPRDKKRKKKGEKEEAPAAQAAQEPPAEGEQPKEQKTEEKPAEEEPKTKKEPSKEEDKK